MMQKLKLLSAVAGLCALVSFSVFSQTKTIDNGDSTSIVENQAGQATDWKEQAPTSAGWRTVRPGMTVDELGSVLPGEVARAKKVEYNNGTRGKEAELKKNVTIDGLSYKVVFSFDSTGHLASIGFSCNSNVKKESFSNIVNSFKGLLGEPTGKENKSFPDGTLMNLASWKQVTSTLLVVSAETPLGGFIKGRLVNVIMHYGEQK